MSKKNRFNSNLKSYQNPGEFLEKAKLQIKRTEIVLDIGCGIYPINFFIPKLHIMVEPWSEYVDILKNRYAKDSRVLIFQAGAIEVLKTLSDDSVDSVFLLDVIEHLEKEQGEELLSEIERVATQQIVVFTPLGFMPQHVENNKLDRWGLSGGDYQEHKSGWLPEDFADDWTFHVCPEFHKFDDQGEKLNNPFGAFYAIKNIDNFEEKNLKPYLGYFFKPTAKDQELNTVTQELNTVTQELNTVTQELNTVTQELNTVTQELKSVTNSISWKTTRIPRLLKALVWKAAYKLRRLKVNRPSLDD
jgi:hypothetical protein